MPESFRLKGAEEVREQQTKEKARRTKQLYKDLYNDVSSQITRRNTEVRDIQLYNLRNDIEERIEEIGQRIEDECYDGMLATSREVVRNIREELVTIGYRSETVERAFFYVPEAVTHSIVNGDIYAENWSLSKAIWKDVKQNQNKMLTIIAKGAQYGKSNLEIAKDLEKFVDPSRAARSRRIISWRYDAQGNKIRDSFYFGDVDYNAQRLSRTMISHAYQQSMLVANEKNPFVEGYRWMTSNFHGRVCEVCRDLEETDRYGLGAGVFPKGELPMDHPNGMCTFEIVTIGTLKEMTARIGEWYNSPSGTDPELDEYAETFYTNRRT